MGEAELDTTFAALADPVRRAILTRLTTGEATLNELAEPFPISLQAVSKHLKVLERAGLITRGRDAQRRPCRLREAPLERSADWIEQHRHRGSDRLDRLEQTLQELRLDEETPTMTDATPGEQEIVFTRTFDARRELVFRAFTDPALVARWWVPKDEELVVETLDARPGGSWRFLNTEADGTRYTFHGVFHEVRSPERIVQTFEYGGMPGQVMLETMTLEDIGGGRTRLTDSSVFQSVAARAAMGGSGDSDGGANESMDRLAELLQTL